MSGRRRGKFRTLLNGWIDGLAKMLEPVFFSVLAVLPISRFGTNPTDAATYRSQVMWEEAIRRGIEMQQLFIMGKKTEVYRARLAQEWHYFQSLPIPPHLEAVRYEWIDDKFKLKQELTRIGVSTPRVYSVTSANEAIEAMRELGGAVVLKPQAGSRGRHTTVYVKTDEEVIRAFESAQKLCRYVVVEQCIEGNVCRGTVVGGKLVGFFEASAPQVVGDGSSTLFELVARANQSKYDRVENIVLTSESVRFLARQGYTERSIVPDGEVASISHRTGRLFGGRTRELLGREHPKLREYLERAAKSVRAPVVGFDLIIKKPEEDPDTQQWGIIEANSLPYIDLHYLPLEGTPSNVAASVWDLWSV